MKEQVIEILRNKLKQGTNKQVIWEADIYDIAEKVVKLFCQHDFSEQSEQFNCLGGNYAKWIKPCEEWCGEDMCQKISN